MKFDVERHRVRFSITPFQPSRNPTRSSPCSTSPLRTTARMTALSPGQSPPPVSSPTRIECTLRGRGSPVPCRADAGARRDRRRNDGGARLRDRRRRVAPRPVVPRIHAAFPAARMGGARRVRDLEGDAGDARGAVVEPRRADRGDRHHQPARDDRGLGSTHRPAPPPSDRVAGPADGRALRRAARRQATSISCGRARAWCSTRTSPRRSSSGSSDRDRST